MDADRPPEVLDYATDRPQRGLRRVPDRIALVVSLMAVGLLVAFAVAGVGSDRVRIPMPKKIALAAAALVVSVLVLLVRVGRPAGCGVIVVLYVLYVLLSMVPLWFWN